jgi:hypothetical protein
MTVASEGCPPCPPWRACNANSGIISIIQPRILMKIMGQIIDECMMAILCSKKKIKIKVPRMRQTMRRSLHYIYLSLGKRYIGRAKMKVRCCTPDFHYLISRSNITIIDSPLYTSVSIIHVTRSNKLHSR